MIDPNATIGYRGSIASGIGLREEPFCFRIFKSHELSDMARRGDVQHKVGCN